MLSRTTPIITTIVFCLCGCNSTENQAKVLLPAGSQQGFAKEIKVTVQITIPLPDHTPFDNDPNARAAYLQSFIVGYKLAVEGWSCTQENLPYRNAMIAGFFEGQTEGQKIALPPVKKEPDQPAPAAGQTSPANN